MGTFYIKNQSGAVVGEFMIALLAFIVLIFGIIDFARYSQAKGVLNSAALDALALATVEPGLSAAVRTDPTFLQAVQNIKNQSRKISEAVIFTKGANSSELTIDEVRDVSDPNAPLKDPRCESPAGNDTSCIILPPTASGFTMEQQFNNIPIEIHMTGTYDPIFPFAPKMPIKIVAAGFREPETTFSMPVPVDCNGVRLGGNYFHGTCACSGAETFNPATRKCECVGTNVAINPSGGCECTNKKPCTNGKYWNDVNCRCQCPSLSSESYNNDCQQNLTTCGCDCSPAHFLTVSSSSGDEICQCRTTKTCTGSYYFNTSLCDCDCRGRIDPVTNKCEIIGSGGTGGGS